MPISATDTAATLYFDKLYALGLDAIAEAVAAVDAGSARDRARRTRRDASHQGLVDGRGGAPRLREGRRRARPLDPRLRSAAGRVGAARRRAAAALRRVGSRPAIRSASPAPCSRSKADARWIAARGGRLSRRPRARGDGREASRPRSCWRRASASAEAASCSDADVERRIAAARSTRPDSTCAARSRSRTTTRACRRRGAAPRCCPSARTRSWSSAAAVARSGRAARARRVRARRAIRSTPTPSARSRRCVATLRGPAGRRVAAFAHRATRRRVRRLRRARRGGRARGAEPPRAAASTRVYGPWLSLRAAARLRARDAGLRAAGLRPLPRLPGPVRGRLPRASAVVPRDSRSRAAPRRARREPRLRARAATPVTPACSGQEHAYAEAAEAHHMRHVLP